MMRRALSSVIQGTTQGVEDRPVAPTDGLDSSQGLHSNRDLKITLVLSIDGRCHDRHQTDEYSRTICSRDSTSSFLRLLHRIFNECDVIPRATAVASKRAVFVAGPDVTAWFHDFAQVGRALLVMAHAEPDGVGRQMVHEQLHIPVRVRQRIRHIEDELEYIGELKFSTLEQPLVVAQVGKIKDRHDRRDAGFPQLARVKDDILKNLDETP